jgi:threonine synthase
MDWSVPDWCVLPVCYGDALLGMWRGFEDMVSFGWTSRMPRMVAAEVYGSIGTALADGTDTPPDMRKNYETVAVSIGATRGTYQALDIVRRSGGTALTIGNDEMMRWQQTLASSEGLFVELSSAASLAAVEQLALSGRIGEHDIVVSLLTASGLKDTMTAALPQKDLLAVPTDFNDALGVLRAAKIFPH